ncbi:molybdopterin molybdotransferase MoeA [Belliella sp. DSM 107340]|uniref:Molybdopterin molybdenumtransferase n=1 Tax=Belliella calami TaxID=2923436 RepID=A0ABS9UQ82_9BACT|nr:gephyrin-like molybdotransferase Glp [Belliella calami]MCH7398789.1 molybdopterin molybdotransferase MoeA [Belliella calami]
MINVEEAKKRISEILISRKIEICPISESTGLFCAEEIFSPISVPSFDNSAMDGYALAFGDLKPEMVISGEVKAGVLSVEKLRPGTVVRIFTGAPIPEGADTVVKQEVANVYENKFLIDVNEVKKGGFVRKAGAQCEVGEKVLEVGSEISSGTIALLASLGIEGIKVFSKPRIGVILTGDEVVEPGQKLENGQIYDANGPMLTSALMKLGVKPAFVEKVKDDADVVRSSVERLVEQVDVLILSGGISVGDYDFVRPTMQDMGVEELFYKVAQKPGKPLFVGKLGSKIIFALPGNPSSSLSCFMVYVKPFIRHFCGANDAFESNLRFPLSETYHSESILTFFLKCQLKNGMIHLLKGQESFNLISFNTATGLVEIPGINSVSPENSNYNYYPF